jgi:hypothetical protein
MFINCGKFEVKGDNLPTFVYSSEPQINSLFS